MLLAAIASYELASRNRLVLSGLVLALALMKFHLILLVPVAMLMRRAWKMLAGFCAGAAAGVLIGLALGGIEGVGRNAGQRPGRLDADRAHRIVEERRPDREPGLRRQAVEGAGGDSVILMSNPEIRYSLSKSESKLFSSLVKLGGQTKQELLLTSSLNIEKADEALLTLINKSL